MNEINQELQAIYQSYFENLKGKTLPPETSNPLLMHIYDEYMTSKVKVMIVGKETNSWGNLSQTSSIKPIIKMYKDFALGHGWYNKSGKVRMLNSPFWNFSRSIFAKLNDGNRRSKGFLWTNVSKFDTGKNNRTPDLAYRYKEGFELLRKEIKITGPDLILFVTGNDYDVQIKEYINLESSPLEAHPYIDILKDNKGEISAKMYKINHPNWLRYNKKYWPVLNQLIALNQKESV